MENIELTALTNALTDITVNIKEADLKKLGIKKGSASSIRKIDQEYFRKMLLEKEKSFCQAGSPANTIFNASVLGLKTQLLGSLAYDEIGDLYLKNLEEAGITALFGRNSSNSGVCYILITPDGERSQVPDLGFSGKFNYSLDNLKETKIFHTSGYEISSNPNKAVETLLYSKNKGAKISLDLAARSAITRNRKTIEDIIKKVDILFATEEEAEELTGLSPYRALKELSKICPILALKKGSKGSVVRKKQEEYKIPIYPVKLANTCGAGDAYAAGFLFSYIRGFNINECGNMGSYIASRVCASEKSNLYSELAKK